jgi:hypothetical protein
MRLVEVDLEGRSVAVCVVEQPLESEQPLRAETGDRDAPRAR